MMRQFGAISKDFERSDSKKHQEISIFLTRSLYIEQILKVNLHMFFPWGGAYSKQAPHFVQCVRYCTVAA